MNSTIHNQSYFGELIFSMETMPYLVLNAVGILIGFFGKQNNFTILKQFFSIYQKKGNILLFTSILFNNQLKAEQSNIIVLSMTVAHFYSCTFVGLFSEISLLFGEKFIGKYSRLHVWLLVKTVSLHLFCLLSIGELISLRELFFHTL